MGQSSRRKIGYEDDEHSRDRGRKQGGSERAADGLQGIRLREDRGGEPTTGVRLPCWLQKGPQEKQVFISSFREGLADFRNHPRKQYK